MPSKSKDTAQTGVEHVEHERIQPDQNTDDLYLGDDQDQQRQSGISRSIRLGTALPSTVLHADMGDGGAVPLGLARRSECVSEFVRRGTTMAVVGVGFGSTDLTPSNGQGEAL